MVKGWDLQNLNIYRNCKKIMGTFVIGQLVVFLNSDAGLLAWSQYSEGPATGHLDTSISRFPCAYKQMLRRFPTFQVATTCFSCSPSDLNLIVTNFILCKCKITTATGWKPSYLLTYSIVQSHSWEANWFAASQEILLISRNPKVRYRTHNCPPPVSTLGQPNPYTHIPPPGD